MDTVFFETDTIRLSMRSPETGRALMANVYTLQGVENADGTLRQMSIGQLVMAVCLKRATKLEADVVQQMTEMAANTDQLNAFSTLETKLLAYQTENDKITDPANKKKGGTWAQLGYKESELPSGESLNNAWSTWLNAACKTNYGFNSGSVLTDDEISQVCTTLEESMDSLNTVSQEKLIEIQSLTSKRDDTYTLISNMLKSVYTVLTGNANNL